MMKSFDVSKLRKSITKSIPGMSVGFNDPTVWLDTGSKVLNFLVSKDFNKGVPAFGKMSVVSGDSGSCKSYVVSGNVVKDAQKKGIFCVIFDTENALDNAWLSKLGVDTSEDKLLRMNVATVDEIGQGIQKVIDWYEEENAGIPLEEQSGMLIVVDSLGMAVSGSEMAQAESGDMKGDLGRKAKQLISMCRTALARIGSKKIGLVCTQHSYASQDMFNPDKVIAGGTGIIYSSSVIIFMEKYKLKEDEFGNKISEVVGTRVKATVRKSRYNPKIYSSVEIMIPFDSGMNPYSGCFSFFEKNGVLVKSGNRYAYKSPITGEESWIKWRKEITTSDYDKMMNEYMQYVQKQEEVSQSVVNNSIDGDDINIDTVNSAIETIDNIDDTTV